MDVTAESARLFGLTLKEKKLEAIWIHYQQAMESPLFLVVSLFVYDCQSKMVFLAFQVRINRMAVGRIINRLSMLAAI